MGGMAHSFQHFLVCPPRLLHAWTALSWGPVAGRADAMPCKCTLALLSFARLLPCVARGRAPRGAAASETLFPFRSRVAGPNPSELATRRKLYTEFFVCNHNAVSS